MQGPGNLVKAIRSPITGERIVRDLRRLGVEPGQIVLVHSSLKSLGWVVGGAPAVVSALRTAVGPDGHVVVPTGTEANSLRPTSFNSSSPRSLKRFSTDLERQKSKECPC